VEANGCTAIRSLAAFASATLIALLRRGRAARFALDHPNARSLHANPTPRIGGLGVVGSRTETTDLPGTAQGYKETSLSIGGFTYNGKSQPALTGVSEDWFNRSGVKVDAWWKDLNVFGAVVAGRDNLRGSAARKVDSSTIMAEADYRVLPWVMPTMRFEKTNYSDGRRNVIKMIPSTSFLIRANVRVIAEGHFFNHVNATAPDRTGLNEGLLRLEFLF